MTHFETTFRSKNPKNQIVVDENILDVTTLNPDEEVSILTTINGASNLKLYWTTTDEKANAIAIPEGPLVAAKQVILNDSVSVVYKNNDTLYCGGKFSQVNGEDCGLICSIKKESILDKPFSSFGPTEFQGEVRSILKHKDFLIVAGNYNGDINAGGFLGRSLNIVNQQTGALYAFYVSGTINCLTIKNDSLYIGGSFSSINYTAQKASLSNDLLVNCNGLVKLHLDKLEKFPQHAIDQQFADRFIQQINTVLTVNALITIQDKVFVAGNFELNFAKNLFRLNYNDAIDETFQPIVDGSINCLYEFNDNLYVGGNFKYVSSLGILSLTDLQKTSVSVNNLFRIKNINTEYPKIDPGWKINIDGGVYGLTNYENVLYAYGQFKVVNGQDVKHLVAIDTETSSLIKWPFYLQSGPVDVCSQSITTTKEGILIGGTFTQINDTTKGYVACLPFAVKKQSQPTTQFQIGTIVFSEKRSLKVTNEMKNYVNTDPSLVGSALTVNKTTIPLSSKDLIGCASDVLVEFFIKNPDNNIQKHLLGWTIE